MDFIHIMGMYLCSSLYTMYKNEKLSNRQTFISRSRWIRVKLGLYGVLRVLATRVSFVLALVRLILKGIIFSLLTRVYELMCNANQFFFLIR